jgi:hypothetical protein
MAPTARQSRAALQLVPYLCIWHRSDGKEKNWREGAACRTTGVLSWPTRGPSAPAVLASKHCNTDRAEGERFVRLATCRHIRASPIGNGHHLCACVCVCVCVCVSV